MRNHIPTTKIFSEDIRMGFAISKYGPMKWQMENASAMKESNCQTMKK